jgi:hypothetical protein
VARTAQMAEDQIAFGETHLFVGTGYVVSVRRRPTRPCAIAASPARRRLPRGRTTSFTPSSTSSWTITAP